MSDQPREHRAFQEAGRVLIAHLIGVPIREVYIDPDEAVVFQRRPPEAQLKLVGLGGWLSVYRLRRPDDETILNWESDARDEPFESGVSGIRSAKQAMAWIEDALLANWAAVTRLANALLRMGRLSGDDASRLIGEA